MAKKLSVFDFDNTLAVSTARVKVINGNKVSYLSPFEYANYKKKSGDTFDFSEFDEIKSAEPVEKYMDKLKNSIDNNNDVVILTARGRKSGKHIVRYLQSQGIDHGVSIRTMSSGKGTAKKRYVRNKLQKGNYSAVDFFDDHPHNVESVASLQNEFPGVKITGEVVPEKEYKHLIKKSSARHDPTEPKTRAQSNYRRQGRMSMNLNRRIRNPETGNDILMRTALGYPKSSQVYQLAKRTLLDKR